MIWEAILNTVWLNNSFHFGLRGIKVHHAMQWDDVKLCKTDQLKLLNTYSSTSDRQKQEPAWTTDVKAFAPKMFSTNESENEPVAVYKMFAQKWPQKMNDPGGPFYIAVNNLSMKSKSTEKCWFKCNAVGINKLGSLMKEMSRKAGLDKW